MDEGQGRHRTMIDVAVGEATKLLDTDRRAWVVGVAWLSDTPPDAPVPDLDRAARTMEWALRQQIFPSGALHYVADGAVSYLAEDIATISFRHADPQGNTFLETLVGFGVGGFVAVGMTRSGHLGAQTDRPSHVLISDVESTCCDLLTVADLLIQMTGYIGPVQMAVDIASDVTGRPMALRAFDSDTGELVPEEQAATRFDRVHGRFGTTDDALARSQVLWRLALDAVHQFGAENPTFVRTAEFVDVEAEARAHVVPPEVLSGEDGTDRQ